MANIIKGTEQKFAINLQAEGFSMDTDDFDVSVISPKATVSGSKGASTADVTIFRDPALDDNDPQEGTWYVIVNTASLSTGDARVVATAYIPDANANDGVRNEVVSAPLGKIVNP